MCAHGATKWYHQILGRALTHHLSVRILLPQDPTQSRFLVPDAILAYLGFGGVRIEDNMLVMETGSESMTSVPRTCEEVEAVMAGGSW